MLNKTLKTIFFTGVFLIISVMAFSQGMGYWDNWDRRAGSSWWNNGISSQYALSSDQIQKINDIRLKYNQKLLPLQNELDSVLYEARSYSLTPDADVSRIKIFNKKSRALEGQISDISLDMQAEIDNILTPAQRLNFNNGGYGWWDNDRDWWFGGSGMGYGNSGRMGIGGTFGIRRGSMMGTPYCW